eukprot:3181648-Amphidinium_carterae.1
MMHNRFKSQESLLIGSFGGFCPSLYRPRKLQEWGWETCLDNFYAMGPSAGVSDSICKVQGCSELQGSAKNENHHDMRLNWRRALR